MKKCKTTVKCPTDQQYEKNKASDKTTLTETYMLRITKNQNNPLVLNENFSLFCLFTCKINVLTKKELLGLLLKQLFGIFLLLELII